MKNFSIPPSSKFGIPIRRRTERGNAGRAADEAGLPNLACYVRRRWLWIVALFFILLATGPLLFLRHRTPQQSRPDHPASVSRTETPSVDRSRLTNDQEHILLGNIATIPFQELYDFLAQRTPSQISTLARQLAAQPPGAITDAKIRLFFKAWAALDAKAAFATAEKFADRGTRSNAIEAIIDGVSPNEAADAVRALMDLPPGEVFARPSLLFRGITRWSEADPASAAEFLRTTGAPAIKADGQDGMGMAMVIWGTVAQNFGATDPVAALAWAAKITDAQHARSALQGAIVGWSQIDAEGAMSYVAARADQLAFQQAAGTLASNLAVHDPDKAREWLEQLPPEARLHAVTGIAGTLAFADPQAAIRWAENLSPDDKESVIGMIVARGAQTDPEAVADWIGTLSGATRDSAIATFSSAVAATDPVTALNWAETLFDPKNRERASWEAAWRWLQSDPTAAKAWIQNSSLPDAEKARLLAPAPGQ